MWCLRSLTVMVSGAPWSPAGKPSSTGLGVDTVSDGAVQTALVPAETVTAASGLAPVLPLYHSPGQHHHQPARNPSVHRTSGPLWHSSFPALKIKYKPFKEDTGSLGTCLPACLVGFLALPAPVCPATPHSVWFSSSWTASCPGLCLCYNHRWNASPVSLPCVWPVPAHLLGVNFRVTSRKSWLICNCTLPILS